MFCFCLLRSIMPNSLKIQRALGGSSMTKAIMDFGLRTRKDAFTSLDTQKTNLNSWQNQWLVSLIMFLFFRGFCCSCFVFFSLLQEAILDKNDFSSRCLICISIDFVSSLEKYTVFYQQVPMFFVVLFLFVWLLLLLFFM